LFKKQYKACFDDIKGDYALLEKILKQADTPKYKRIKFNRIYKYTASIAAAIVVVVSSAYLYNTGVLKADIKEVSPVQNTTTENTIQNEMQSEIQNENNKTQNEALIKFSRDTDTTAESSAQNKSVNTDSSKKLAPANTKDTESAVTQKQKTVTEKTVVTNDITDTGNTEVNTDIVHTNIDTITSEDTVDNKNTSASDNAISEEAAYTEKIAPASGGGSEDASAFSAKRAIPENDITAQAVSADSEVSFKLPLFKEGILDEPEYEYISAEKTIVVYKDKAMTKRIELTLYTKEPDTIPEGEKISETSDIYIKDNTYSAFSKSADGYIVVTAENISAEYMNEIIQSF